MTTPSRATSPPLVDPRPANGQPRSELGERMAGLDGVRALAVIAVVVYHANSVDHSGHAWLPGGFFGVDLFFVISGYLITGILVRQWQGRRAIDLRNFWLRRARRLLPAVIALIVAVIVVSNLVASDAVYRLAGDVPAALFYVTNWWFVVHKDSYFAAQGRPPLLLHLWSLAIEEQFYVVWPLVLTFLLPRLRRLRSLAIGTAVAALLSTGLMAVLFRPGHDASRVYFGTDTHAQGLLIGCTLALLIPPGVLSGRRSGGWRWGLDAGGTVALAGLAALMVLLTDSGTFTYRGGFLVVDLAAAAVVLAAASPVTSLGWALARQPLSWVGTRSYAIYLWHWPIDQWMRPHLDVGFGGIPLFLLQAGFTAVAAEASYRFVEQPVRSGRAQAWIKSRFSTTRAREPWILVPGLVVLLLAVDVLAATPPKVTGVLAEGSTAAAHTKLTPVGGQVPTSSRAKTVSRRDPSRPPPTAGARPASTTSAPTTAPASTTPASTTPTSTPTAALGPGGQAALLAADEPVLAIGDSVLLAASPALQARFGPGITVDAAVGRHVDDGISRLQAYRSTGRLSQYKTLIIDLGTNGPMSTNQFNQIVTLAVGVPHILFVNTYDRLSWAAPTNAVIAAGVAAHPGVKLVDWSSAAKANTPLLYQDQIHPDPAGAVLYTNLVVSALDPAAAAANPSPTQPPPSA